MLQVFIEDASDLSTRKQLETLKIWPNFLPEVAGRQCIANFEEFWTNMDVIESTDDSPKYVENPSWGSLI